MKRFFLFAAGVLICITAMAQEPQFDSTVLVRKAVFNIEKPNFAKDMNVIANTRYALNNNFMDGNHLKSNFQMNEFRFEIVGSVTDRIKYRFRDRYAGMTSDPLREDVLRNSLDLAYVTVDVSPRLSIGGGKMATDWGSFEFQLNPIYIYAYNDLIQYNEHFVSGVQAHWKASNNHTFGIQALNVRNSSFEENFGSNPDLEPTKTPLAGLVNWRGTFADGMFNTIWSYAIYNEVKSKYAHYFALGNELLVGNLRLQYDFKFTTEDVDRLGVLSSLISSEYPYRAEKVQYLEHWIRSVYFLTPRLSATLIGMVSTNYWRDNNLAAIGIAKTNQIRTSWSFTAALEYYIYKPYDFKLFVTYVGRYHNFTNYAKQEFGLSNYNTGQLLFGFITPLVLF